MWLVGVLWACVVLGGALVLWACGGVSIIREWEKSKANPHEKSKKNLTRVLKKPILKATGGVKNFYEKGEKNFFISIGKFKFEWMWGK